MSASWKQPLHPDDGLDIQIEQVDPKDLVEPLRGKILLEAADKTLISRNASYGDPLPNLLTIAQLQTVFWNSFTAATERALAAASSPEEKQAMQQARLSMGRSSAHGQALDMVFVKLGRIATGTTLEPHQDSYEDAAAFFAIAYENAVRAAEGPAMVGTTNAVIRSRRAS